MTRIINIMKQHRNEDDGNFWLNRVDDVAFGLLFFAVIGVALS